MCEKKSFQIRVYLCSIPIFLKKKLKFQLTYGSSNWLSLVAIDFTQSTWFTTSKVNCKNISEFLSKNFPIHFQPPIDFSHLHMIRPKKNQEVVHVVTRYAGSTQSFYRFLCKLAKEKIQTQPPNHLRSSFGRHFGWPRWGHILGHFVLDHNRSPGVDLDPVT